MRRLLVAMIGVAGCTTGGSGASGGLVVVSDTAMIGSPPVCEADSESESGSDSGDSDSDSDGVTPRAGEDPGTGFCAQFTSSAACDFTPRMNGDEIVGDCHWVTVVPVLPGTCDATTLYETCVYVPRTGESCAAPQSCGQVGLGVFGRTGCDGTVEIIVNPPGESFCASPTDWPLCWPDGDSPECTCVCA